MNYGKSNLSRRKKRISSKKRMKKKRVGVRLFKAFVLCILLLGIVGVAAGGVFVKHVIDNTPEARKRRKKMRKRKTGALAVLLVFMMAFANIFGMMPAISVAAQEEKQQEVTVERRQ